MRLTKQGYNKFSLQMQALEIERKEVLERLVIARGFGDLKENAEYNEARTRLMQIDHELENIKSILGGCVILDHIPEKDFIDFGAIVTLLKDNKEEVFQIVSELESDYDEGKLSENSPFAKVLIKKKINDIVEFSTPHSKHIYKVLNIQYNL